MKTLKLAGSVLVLGALLSAANVSNAAKEAAGTPDAASADRPWMRAGLTADKRADLLLAAMTLDEKISLLHGPMALPFPPVKLPEGAIGAAGFIQGVSRLGIPNLIESDASLGVTNPMMVRGADDMSTALPSSLLLAASFAPELAFKGGAMVGTEARAKGINVQLAGGVNLLRDPRNGRNFEYVGEDPWLAGVMAGEQIRGVQSVGLVSTVKHFSINDQEHKRMTADSVIGEAAHRESDLLAFQIAIERGDPGSVMCAYNMVNGTYACEHDGLLNATLKRDWGFKGWVMSDWGAVHSVEALTNGLDQQSGEQIDKQVWFDKPLKQAIAEGRIPVSRVDDAVRRILRTMFAHGLFDNPPKPSRIDFEANGKVAQAVAEEGIVLLENDGILPLAATARHVAVIGAHVEAGVPAGGGSSQVGSPFRPFPQLPPRTVPLGGEGIIGSFATTVFHPSPPLKAIRDRLKDSQVSFDNGAYLASAVEKAKTAEMAIVFAYQPSAEGDDTPDMSLPFGQDALIEAVAAANPNTIVVLQTGNPVRMPWAGKVRAVVQGWYSGQKGGEAIARVLFGEVNPSGRLPLSWPVDESQLPRPKIPGWGEPDGSIVRIDYNIEGSDVGYRWFARQGLKPRYWFGHGLSYTSFAYSGLKVSGGETLSASVEVTNSGQSHGKDVVQLYLTSRPGGPALRLLGFMKVDLKPGETRRVTIAADPRLLADFDEKAHGWSLKGGTYQVAVGPNAGEAALTGRATVSARRIKP